MSRLAWWMRTLGTAALMAHAGLLWASPPMAQTRADAESAPRSEVKLALDEARAQIERGEYDRAIAGLTKLIADRPPNEADRSTCYDYRSAAYVGRKKSGDARLALADAKAAGWPGLYVTAIEPHATLQMGRKTTGTLERGKVALVTHVNGDWLWVESVGKDEKAKGYVKLDSVASRGLIENGAWGGGFEEWGPGSATAPAEMTVPKGKPRAPSSPIGGKRLGGGSAAQTLDQDGGRPATEGQRPKGTNPTRTDVEQTLDPKSDRQSSPTVKSPIPAQP